MSAQPKNELDFLGKAGFVLLALQASIFAKMWNDLGFDRATEGFPILVLVTALLIARQRKLLASPPNRGVAHWLLASRLAVLAMLTLATVVVGFYRLVPQAAPPPDFVPRVLFALMWSIIALKGAGIGKLKPGSAVGLCVSWTRQSRLAWDRAHRALGRVLFWGGLAGLATSLVVHPLASVGLWMGTVATAVATGLIESWRAWRLDPDRGRPA